MKKWGFKPKVPVDIMDFADKKKRIDWIKNKNMKVFNLVNPAWALREIDIIINTPVNYEKAAKNLNYVTLHGVSIPTISIRHLIEMKKWTVRRQDKEDIESLKKILNEK